MKAFYSDKDILMTFPIAHFENKRNFFAAFNGGKLCVTDDEYIIKWLFVKKVVEL